MYDRLTGEQAPYNLRFVTNGVACTMASVAAAALGIRDLDRTLRMQQVQRIQQLHLLLAMYNAFQPGVFALSGWDLVGALPLAHERVAHLIADGDTRWINRGAYDLMDVNATASASGAGLPKARALYGSLPAQLEQPNSFVNQLKALLKVRQAYRIYAARQIDVPDVQSPGLLVMVHELPDGLGTQITALNFGATSVDGDRAPVRRARRRGCRHGCRAGRRHGYGRRRPDHPSGRLRREVLFDPAESIGDSRTLIVAASRTIASTRGGSKTSHHSPLTCHFRYASNDRCAVTRKDSGSRFLRGICSRIRSRIAQFS